MITIEDYKDAAAKCQAVNRPNETAYLLYAAASYMLDREQGKASQADMNNFRDRMNTAYSYAAPPAETITYKSDTDFGKAITGLNINDVLPIMDELMTATSIYRKSLYHKALNRLYELKQNITE